MRSTRIAATPWLRSRAELRAVGSLAGAPHRVLRTLTGPWIIPPLSPRLPHAPALGGLLRALGGRMIIANPNVAARLPREVAPFAAAVLAARLEGSLGAEGAAATTLTPTSTPGGDVRDAAERRRIAAFLGRLPDDVREALLRERSVRWVAAALLEPATLDVHLSDAGGGAPTAPARFVAYPRYRLLLAAGAGEPPEWDALEAEGRRAHAVSWPPAREPQEAQPWFQTSLLVPDALAADDMDDTALGHWGAVTGRAGPSSRDRYWFADSWERFREPGRLVGHVTPQLVGRSRRLGRPSGEFEIGGALALTPDFERGTSVPPGYCLLDCVGTLEIAPLTY